MKPSQSTKLNWVENMELFKFLGAMVLVCVSLPNVLHCSPILIKSNIERTSGADANGQMTVTTILQADQIQKIFENVSNTILDQIEERFVRLLRQHDISDGPKDCQDIGILGYTTTWVYTIYPTASPDGFQVRCFMDTDGGGWTVIQRRLDGSTNFYRTWNEYEMGFGSANHEYWLGIQLIHLLTTRTRYELRIDMTDADGVSKSVKYNVFRVDGSENGYRLHLDGFNTESDIKDSFSYHSGQKFSTFDRDNDNHSSNCAQKYKGGWWYKDCHQANINGKYAGRDWTGLVWGHWTQKDESLVRTEMKIRRHTT